MLQIGSGFQLPPSIDLRVLDRLPVIDHKYGDPQPDSMTFKWMRYVQPEGYISFARNLGAYMPLVAYHVTEYLKTVIDVPIPFARVNFMKTAGCVGPHRDEGGRKSVINIGIRNASAAITRVSLDNDFDTFETEYEDYTVEDGCAYVLDVDNVHAVLDQKGGERLLITCGFGVPARELLKRVK